MNAHVSSLDIDKFRKVIGLMRDPSTTDSERAAAKGKAELIAARAGLSLETALSLLNIQKPVRPPTIFDGFDDWMEKREPGWTAKRAAERAERLRKDAIRRIVALTKHRSEEAVFAPTREEVLLDEAVSTWAMRRGYTDHLGITRSYVSSLDGAREIFWMSHVTARVRDRVAAAYPIASRLDGVIQEIDMWNTIRDERELFLSDGEFIHDLPVKARIVLLESELDTRPVAGWDDMEARIAWRQRVIDQGVALPHEDEQRFVDRLRGDFEILRHLSAARRQPKRRKRADNRQADMFSTSE